MEKRVVVTIAVCMAILLGWWFVQTKFFPPAKPPTETAQTPPPAPAPSAPTPAPTANAPAPTANAPAPTANAPAPAPPAKAEPKTVTVQRDGLYLARFSSRGAAPVEFTLLNPRYKTSVDGHDVPINLARPEAGFAPFAASFITGGAEHERSDVDLPPDAVWTQEESKDPNVLVYAIDVGDLHVTKRWEIPQQGYRLGLSVTVENRAKKDDPKAASGVNTHLIMTMTGWQDPSVKPGGFLSFGRRPNLSDGECDIAGKVHRENLEDAVQKPFGEAGDVKWVGIGEQYFISALAFAPAAEGRYCTVHGEPNGRLYARAVFPLRKMMPGDKVTWEMAGYLGPKLLSDLDAVTVGGVDANLNAAVNYTLEWLARPMLFVLKQIQRVTVNWGIAIIIITILLKALLFYPNQRSMRSAKKMAALKPQLDKLKERHGDDKQAFYLAQQKLFKDNGVSMFGGCLPMLLQMPIYFAFYSMLGNAVELYHARFFGPMNDLTSAYWPLAVVTGALMFLQQRISPTSPDSQQQKMMMYMMPIMFMVFTLFLPSGLTLYILTNTLLTMAQQWWVNRTEPTTAPVKRPTRPARA